MVITLPVNGKNWPSPVVVNVLELAGLIGAEDIVDVGLAVLALFGLKSILFLKLYSSPVCGLI